jgi:glycosyltransferase involved in cell wall biosynthesis
VGVVYICKSTEIKTLKKLLILAYDFPPYVSVGGLRPHSWFKYLKEFGVEPIVVTRQWRNEYSSHLDYIARGWSDEVVVEVSKEGTIIRSPYKPNLSNRLLLKYGEKRFRFLRKLLSGFYEFAQFFFPVGTKIELYKAARVYLKDNRVDAIIATGDPFVLFHYANKLSEEYGLAWIADYRDPWSNDVKLNKSLLSKKIFQFIELRICRKASRITTVSEYFKFKIGEFSKLSKKVDVIPNGYDFPESIRISDSPSPKSEKLTICYAGSIYPWHPIEKVVEVLKTNFSESIRLKLIGTKLKSDALQIESNSNVEIIGTLSHEDTLQHLMDSDINLLFNDYPIVGSKIYELLGIKKPILFCFSELTNTPHFTQSEIQRFTPQMDLIHDYQGGFIAQNEAHLKILLEKLVQEYKLKGTISSYTNDTSDLSRLKQVKKMAKLVFQIAN